MLDRITTVPCPSAPECGGAVTLRLGYAPEPAARPQLRLIRAVDSLRQTCACDLTEHALSQLGAQVRPGRVRRALA